MAGGIDTETVYTHLDELTVAFYQIFSHSRVLGIQVYTVTGNLSPPTVGFVPVPCSSHMVPIVMRIVINAIGIFHQGQATLVL